MFQRYPDQAGKTVGSETECSKNQKLFYHILGTPQTEDVLVAEFPEEPSIIMSVFRNLLSFVFKTLSASRRYIATVATSEECQTQCHK